MSKRFTCGNEGDGDEIDRRTHPLWNVDVLHVEGSFEDMSLELCLEEWGEVKLLGR